jgi:hypothetical protein
MRLLCAFAARLTVNVVLGTAFHFIHHSLQSGMHIDRLHLYQFFLPGSR